jgi:RNA polymerase sigma factor (sigma-70 family)
MGSSAARLLSDDRLAERAAAGDERAFEALYDRHHRALLGFCRHMLGTREEAEDALQQTFLRVHRALARHGEPSDLRPWLFTIARNCCLTLLAARRPDADLEAVPASMDGLSEQVQARADLRAIVADVERLPDDQRAALVLSQLSGLSHEEIGDVIGVRTAKVKALIHQARTTLIAERDARETPCAQIREQLATAQNGALRRGPLRRHLRGCAPCRAYRMAVADQRRALNLALPATPSLGLKAGILGAAGGGGAAGAGAAASVGGGAAAKLAVGALLVGGAGGGGLAIVKHADPPVRPVAATAAAATRPAVARKAPTRAVATPPRRAVAHRAPAKRAHAVRPKRHRKHAPPAHGRPAPRAERPQPKARSRDERMAAKVERKAARTKAKAERKVARAEVKAERRAAHAPPGRQKAKHEGAKPLPGAGRPTTPPGQSKPAETPAPQPAADPSHPHKHDKG